MWLPLLYCGLFISILFGASSRNWFTLVVCIELNLIMILPILFYRSNLISRESVIIYLLAQSVGSLLILLVILVERPLFIKLHRVDLTIFSALIIKFGVVPLHFWFVGLMSFRTSLNYFLLSTTQKLLPTILMINTELFDFLIVILILSCFIPLINVLSNKIKVMLAYSSIFQMALFLVSLQIRDKIGLIYFGIYCFTMIPVCYWLIFMSNKLFIGAINENRFKLPSILRIAMIMGLPPFSIFVPKLYLLINRRIIIFLLLVLFVVLVINMFIYLRVVSQIRLYSSNLSSLRINKKKDFGVILFFNLFPWLLFLCGLKLNKLIVFKAINAILQASAVWQKQICNLLWWGQIEIKII